MSDLQHYIETGEVPDDLETLNRLYQEAIGAEGVESEQVESEAKAKESAATGAGGSTNEVVVEKEPDGILTKDGKHVISYDVLKSERQAAQQYRAKTEQLEREIEALKSGKTGEPENLEAFSGMTEEQLAELKDYFPDQYEAIVNQQKALQAASEKLAEVNKQEAERQAQAREQIAATVQEEIDNNPVLSHWQRNNPDIWEECCEQDKMMLNNPKFASLPIAERFDLVAKVMAQKYGSPIKVETKIDAVETKPVRAKATAQSKPPINSLSDLPGGEAVEVSEKQRVEDMSAAELGDMLMKMSPEKQAEFLSRL